MKFFTDYWGMMIYAEDEEEGVFLKKWFDEMNAKLEKEKNAQSYDGQEIFGMEYDKFEYETRHSPNKGHFGAVSFIR